MLGVKTVDTFLRNLAAPGAGTDKAQSVWLAGSLCGHRGPLRRSSGGSTPDATHTASSCATSPPRPTSPEKEPPSPSVTHLGGRGAYGHTAIKNLQQKATRLCGCGSPRALSFLPGEQSDTRRCDSLTGPASRVTGWTPGSSLLCGAGPHLTASCQGPIRHSLQCRPPSSRHGAYLLLSPRITHNTHCPTRDRRAEVSGACM